MDSINCAIAEWGLETGEVGTGDWGLVRWGLVRWGLGIGDW
ncbi:hypothetical protein [Oscillatoria salina]|nr:hypothetical protein [Oscillatoria salina]